MSLRHPVASVCVRVTYDVLVCTMVFVPLSGKKWRVCVCVSNYVLMCGVVCIPLNMYT